MSTLAETPGIGVNFHRSPVIGQPEITHTIQRLERQTEDEKVKNIKSAIEYFDEIIKTDIPSKQILAQVLDKVIITKNKNLEFKLKINIDELI